MKVFFKALTGLLVFILLVFCALRVFSDSKTAEAERRYPPQGAFIEAEGVKIHYVRKGNGRPVILIHGSFGSVNDFTFSVFDRASEKYDVTAFDRSGHGYSERLKRSMTLFDHAEILHEAARALGIEKPIVAGHSLGGAVALAYAERYPDDVSAVVLLAGYITPYDGPLRWIHRAPAWPIVGPVYLKALVQPMGLYLQNQIARRVFSSGLTMPDGYLETASALARRPKHFQANAEDIRNLPAGLKNVHEQIGKLQMPVIYLAGEHDAVAPKERHAERLKQLLPSAEVLVISGGGHQPSFTAPDKVLEVLDLAWRRVDERLAVIPKESSANPPESTELPER